MGGGGARIGLHLLQRASEGWICVLGVCARPRVRVYVGEAGGGAGGGSIRTHKET